MKRESNYQIIDPCYGPEEDKEGGTQTRTKIIEIDRMLTMKMETKMDEQIGVLKIKIAKNMKKRINKRNDNNIIYKTEANTHNRTDNK